MKLKKKKLGGIDFLLFPANPTIFLYRLEALLTLIFIFNIQLLHLWVEETSVLNMICNFDANCLSVF